GRSGGAGGRNVAARWRPGAAAGTGAAGQARGHAERQGGGQELMRTTILRGLALAAGLLWCVMAVADDPPPDKLERKSRPAEQKKSPPKPTAANQETQSPHKGKMPSPTQPPEAPGPELPTRGGPEKRNRRDR